MGRQRLRRHSEKFRSLLKAFCKRQQSPTDGSGSPYRADSPSRAVSFPSVFRTTSVGDVPMEVTRDVFAYVLQLDMFQELMKEMSINIINGHQIFDLIDVGERGILDIDELVSDIVES